MKKRCLKIVNNRKQSAIDGYRHRYMYTKRLQVNCTLLSSIYKFKHHYFKICLHEY